MNFNNLDFVNAREVSCFCFVMYYGAYKNSWQGQIFVIQETTCVDARFSSKQLIAWLSPTFFLGVLLNKVCCKMCESCRTHCMAFVVSHWYPQSTLYATAFKLAFCQFKNYRTCNIRNINGRIWYATTITMSFSMSLHGTIIQLIIERTWV